MKKFVSTKQFDELFDHLDDGLTDENGNVKPENLAEWQRRLKHLDQDYVIVGIRPIVNRLRVLIHT